MIVLEWQNRRARFNHDWLKNQYLPKLGHWERLLSDEIEDVGFERRFVNDVLPGWEQEQRLGQALVDDFVGQMSPRTLFGRAPLSRCDARTNGWLPDLVHALWLVRYPVRQWVSAAQTCVESAARAYLDLKVRLSACANQQSLEALRPLSGAFERFRRACLELATAIEKFPDRILVL